MKGMLFGARLACRLFARRDEGYTMAFFAILLLPTMGLFCCAFELGHAWWAQQELVAAARSAAGVGAAYFYNSSRNAYATDAAQSVYWQDPSLSVSFSPATPVAETSNSATTNPPVLTVTVSTSLPSVLGPFFGAAFTSFSLSAQATATRVGCAWDTSTNSAPPAQICSYVLSN